MLLYTTYNYLINNWTEYDGYCLRKNLVISSSLKKRTSNYKDEIYELTDFVNSKKYKRISFDSNNNLQNYNYHKSTNVEINLFFLDDKLASYSEWRSHSIFRYILKNDTEIRILYYKDDVMDNMVVVVKL